MVQGYSLPSEAHKHLDERLIRSLAHPVRVEMLDRFHCGIHSPNQLAQAMGIQLGHAAYHVKVLRKCGVVELVKTEPRRGATEHFYRAVPRSFLGHQDLREVPQLVRPAVSGVQLSTFVDRAARAIDAGTLDARAGTTFHWTTLWLDDLGWNKARQILAKAQADLEKVHSLSQRRLRRVDAEGVAVVVGLAAFEAAPCHNEKAG